MRHVPRVRARGHAVGTLAAAALGWSLLGSASWASAAGAAPFAVSRFDLQDPRVVVQLSFAGGTERPNGPESFSKLVARSGGALAVNGTFFNVRTYETFGNLVTGGRLVQHRDWDDRGTALVIGRDRRARLQTLRDTGFPDYQDAWLVLPAGPRLLTDGRVSLAPRLEGFQDPPLFQRKPRTALGISDDGRMLWVVTIRQNVTLAEAAQTMRRLGVSEALNLDGGTSVGLATGGKVRLHPKTPITQALVVYDGQHPAPQPMRERYAAWLRGSATPTRSAFRWER